MDAGVVIAAPADVALARGIRHDAVMVEGTVIVRRAGEADAAAIQRIYAPIVRDTVTSFEEAPPGVVEMQARMLAPPRLPWLVAEHDERIIGYAYASKHRLRAAYRWSVECSVYVEEARRGRGVGRVLYRHLFEELRELGYVSLFAGITLPNPPSVALHEALGFEPIGVFRRIGYKHGAWHDVGWWQRALKPPPADPEEPRMWNLP